HANGQSESCWRGQTAIAAVIHTTFPRHRRDNPIGPHAPDTPIIGVAEVEAAIRPHTDTRGAIELGLRGRAAVTTIVIATRARHGRYDTVWTHAPDAAVVQIAEVEAAIRAEGQAERRRELGLDSR